MSTVDSTRYCAFCGLPLASSFSLGGQRSQEEIDYCCSGCRTVADVQQAEGEQGVLANSLTRLGLAIFFTMNVMVFTMALWSRDIYPDQSFANALADNLRDVFRWASLIFSLPVLWLLGGPIAAGVWSAMRRRAITTDLLVLLGVGAAYGYSIVSVLRDQGHVYFEVGAMVLVFVSLGRWFEAKGKRRTGESLDALTELLPATVRRLNEAGEFREVARSEVVTGDVLRVLPGERFPVDGSIISGQANVDQQMVTGESTPVTKTADDQIYSGTLNIDGDVRVKVSATDGKETVSRLVEMIRTARSVKGQHELLADKIATWFVPGVCAIALAAGWYHGQTRGLDQGILAGLAVALIACPCALGLATPMAIWTALGRAAECGVLFRSGRIIQELASVRAACFDKTGTLTNGHPRIVEMQITQGTDVERFINLAGSLGLGSTHPLSHAIVTFVHKELPATTKFEDFSVETLSGKGLRTEKSEFGTALMGSQRLMGDENCRWPEDLLSKLDKCESKQFVYVAWDGVVRGFFVAQESVRKEAFKALQDCRELELELCLITGDHASRAQVIGKELGLTTQSELLPGDKLNAVDTLRKAKKVAMIGDGLNDAPALAAAHVGVALGCGADVSRDAAGVCLLGDDLRRFPWAVGLARMTNRIVKQNLFWAFAYNCVGIALAASGKLNPIWAAVAMAISSLLVIANSLRLSHYPDQSRELMQTVVEPTDETASNSHKLDDSYHSSDELAATFS